MFENLQGQKSLYVKILKYSLEDMSCLFVADNIGLVC